MAHHKDALKRIRQNEDRKTRNQAVRTFYRNRIKKFRAAVEAGGIEGAESALKQAITAIDRAVTKGLLKKQTGSRYKSRLTRTVAVLKSKKAA